MSIVMETPEVTVHHGDCLDVLASLPDCSVDSVVTDPPYGLANTDPAHVADTITRWVNGERDYLPGGAGFMGKAWDAFVPPVAVWDECLRVLKPGGHVLAFAGTRTMDLMTLGLRLAGFDIRDSIAWMYGSGFPKSLDVSKAIDKSQGENRERQLRFTAWMRSTGITAKQINEATGSFMGSHYLTNRAQAAIATADMLDRMRHLLPEVPEEIERLVAERTGIEWTEYANRPVVGAGKSGRNYGMGGLRGVQTSTGGFDVTAPSTPESSKWQGWGTALKPAFEPVVVARKPLVGTVAANVLAHGTGALNIDASRIQGIAAGGSGGARRAKVSGDDRSDAGAGLYAAGEGAGFTANAAGRFPANVILDESQAAELDKQSGTLKSGGGRRNGAKTAGILGAFSGDEADRTFAENEGGASRFFYTAKADNNERPVVDGVAHPTVKPLDLMRYLVRLVTPKGGVVLEPFAGSGTTLEAAVLEGFRCIGIEREADYIPLIVKRLDKPHEVGLDLFGDVA